MTEEFHDVKVGFLKNKDCIVDRNKRKFYRTMTAHVLKGAWQIGWEGK